MKARSVLSLLLLMPALVAGSPSRPAPKPILGVDPAYIQTATSPCKDFYGFANGAFDQVAIPGEYASYGVNQEIDERNFTLLKGILEASARKGGAKGSSGQRVGDFYAAGMDEARIEKAGLTPLAPVFHAIQAVKTPKELVAMLGRLHVLGVQASFSFGVQVDDKDSSAMIASFYQGGLGLPERDYYLRPGKEADEIRQAYGRHIASLFTLSGDEPTAAQAKAAKVLALETKLAQASRTLVDLRDPQANYHKVARKELGALAAIDWDTYFAAVALPSAEAHVLVGQPEFFKALAGLTASEPMEDWRTYLRWHVLRSASPFLGKAFVSENFAFYGKVLSGTTELRPRWKRVLASADRALGEDLGQLFVKTAFSPAAKERALKMVHFHKEAMRARILAADWMVEATKAQALKKLDTMRSKVGYPDRWRDYSALKVSRQSFLANVQTASAFEFRRRMAKLGKPVDRNEWFMTPQTNNAYYDPSLNEMCFPAGILQPPFFDEKADDAANYGALASTIGHELTHGFDDQGRQYDWQGNLKDWWTAEDAKRFEARAGHIVKQYEAFEVLPGLHINGKQTLGENIADIGGLRVSYEAYKLAIKGKTLRPVDGYTPDQRFFIAFAQGWRTNQRPEALRLGVTTDVHSPVRWRVLGPVADFPEFRKAFSCEAAPTSQAPTAIW
ncbi:MAG: M13 family metallopeptidase [Geothrix sp.]|uniref:M13 family metallopeptidase n=1 Tax=Geothrix sp. TaxID=1962974 RepID=UPI003BB06C66